MVSPSVTSVLLGTMKTFTATVSNTQNTAVTWSVNGVPGGYAAAGTIDAAGVYTAPANLPVPASVSIEAASLADTSRNSTALVTVTSDVSVSVSPLTAPVELGGSQQFAAAVNSAGNPDRSVRWAVSGSGCAGAACGTVDNFGTYRAPQILETAPMSVSVIATSVADPSRSGTGAVTVTSTFSLAVTGPSSVNSGSSAGFTATFTPAPNSNPSRAIAWSVTGTGCAGADCGAISASGTYTAPSIPPVSGAVQITATPQADPSRASSVSVSIVPVVSVSVSPTYVTLLLGGTQAFQATVSGARDTTVTWLVNGVAGGSAASGTILNSQTNPDSTTYTAPSVVPSGGSVTVQAQSNADPTASASATVAITSGGVALTLSPVSATLAVNHAQSFMAAVSGTGNQSVAWQVNGVPGGNAAVGRICAPGSNPCQPITTSNAGSVEYVAPPGLPSPDPVVVTATSQADSRQTASVSVTVLPHVIVNVQPGNVALADTEQLRFTASVTGTTDQQVIWSIASPACLNPAVCGFIDSTGLFTAPESAPSPDMIEIAATSSEDTSQVGTAAITIASGPRIFSLSPTSGYAGSSGGFTLLVTGNNFSPSSPGPASMILVAGSARPTSCASITQCVTFLEPADLQTSGNLSVELRNPDGTLSNTQVFVVLAPGPGSSAIPLTPSSPSSTGNDIVVVELSTNGGSGVAGNVSLTVGAVGAFSPVTGSCVLGGSPVIIQRPGSGTAIADVCLFSVSGLSPSFNYAVSGPTAPDLAITNRAPLGLGILHLTLQVPATAAPGPRTLFVENPELDMAAGTGAIEVR